MLKFDFPVYTAKDPCPVYGNYMMGKDETARSVLLTVMRDVHPSIAQSLDTDLGNDLHKFMTGVMHHAHVAERELNDIRPGILDRLFNTRARQTKSEQAAEKEAAYDSDVRGRVNGFVESNFPACLKEAIQTSHQGDACLYLRDISKRLEHVMRTKHTSSLEYLYPCG